MDIYEYVGDCIRQVRRSKGVTQAQLAAMLQISTNTVSRWETADYRPSLQDVWLVAEALSVPVSALLPLDHGDAYARGKRDAYTEVANFIGDRRLALPDAGTVDC